jgi:hypothetical protein
MAFKRNKFMHKNIMAKGYSGYALSTIAIDQDSRNKLLHFSKLESLPNGTRPPNSFLIAQRNGAMSSRGDISSLSVYSNLAGGRNLEAIESGTLTTNNPVLDRIVSMIMSTTSIVTTSSELSAALQLIANSSSVLSYDVLLGAIFSVTANANGSANGSPFLTALANIDAQAGGPTPLSPEALADFLWNAMVTDYQLEGSFGKKLTEALASVGGGDPASIANEILDRGVLTTAKFIALK